MTVTYIAAWVFLALVAIGLVYGIGAAIMEDLRERREAREEAEQDPFLCETLDEAMAAFRRIRDDYNKLLNDYNELQDRYQDLSMKCRRHAVGIERENVERKSE